MGEGAAAEVGEKQHKEKKLAPPSVTLRRFTPADVDDYFVWASDDRVARFCSYDSYTSKDVLLDYINNTVLPHPYFRAICLEGGRPVGALSLTPPHDGKDPHRAELGYVVAYDYWGKGIVKAAVRKVLETAFQELDGLERIEALVEVDNVPSQRVLEKVGFQREGMLRKFWDRKGVKRDIVVYGFLSTDELIGA